MMDQQTDEPTDQYEHQHLGSLGLCFKNGLCIFMKNLSTVFGQHFLHGFCGKKAHCWRKLSVFWCDWQTGVNSSIQDRGHTGYVTVGRTEDLSQMARIMSKLVIGMGRVQIDTVGMVII